MKQPEDSELQEIVKRVVRRMQGEQAAAAQSPLASSVATSGGMLTLANRSIAIGADHGGFEMKVALIDYLQGQGYVVEDCGTYSKESVDYPDLAQAVAQKVAGGTAWRGIMIDGAGIGSCMAANKVRGVRAAMCYDHASAHNSREHNNANLLTLGAGMIGLNLVKQIADTFLTTEFAGGRHTGRVDKIMALEE